MHSYMKAQDIRYSILAIPPMIALAVTGVQSLGPAKGFDSAKPKKHVGLLAQIAMAGLLVYSLAHTLRVRVPVVSPSYRLAAEELCTRLGPFSCLTFVPERSARPAVMYRLAVESRRSDVKDIYSFGRILRAHQVLRGGKARWPDIEVLSAALKDWNVKYLLLESPTPLNEELREQELQEWLDALIAKEFSLVAEYPVDLSLPRWPVRISRNDFPHRKLLLYERTAPMNYNPNAAPPIRPQRVDFSIGGTS
jgi:hypothetical protein